jgi:hypothetical protein
VVEPMMMVILGSGLIVAASKIRKKRSEKQEK